MAAYVAASLFHHVHNAEHLGQYPNMPAWISAATVYGAWIGMTAIGAAGYLLFRRGRRPAGLALLLLYGAAGLYGFSHYALAPVSAHTLAMNFSIWAEAATALALLAWLVVETATPHRTGRRA
jgi:hypothetical protein